MTEERSNPHDSFSRRMLARPENAAAVIRPQLPPALARQIDWDSLELQSGSYIAPELQNLFSDLPFRARLNGRPAYIYCLLEHQSSSDRFMAFRMLEYTVRIWRGHLARCREEHKRDPERMPKPTMLPVVIPVVLHVDARGRAWSAPTELGDLLDIDAEGRAALGPYLPRLEFLLDDVAVQDAAAIRERDVPPAVRLLLVALRVAPRNTDLGKVMLDMFDELRALDTGPDPLGDLKALLTYLFKVGETPAEDIEPVFEQLGPRGKEAVVTTEEMIAARVEARAAARTRVEMLLELMSIKFGSLPDAVVQRVWSADADQVRGWAARVLTALTLEEMFV
ncbi:Rpn family recombination-promoting nuclease/putative transposase [Nocardia nova]|uniref:Rpn family recombination-promoting nuclease/putative transposase n=1 Tax=Nocardia nova TaxID=37330 RepID=UPI0033EFCF42